MKISFLEVIKVRLSKLYYIYKNIKFGSLCVFKIVRFLYTGGTMSFYLLEIGTEELPAGFINPACDYLKTEFKTLLRQNNIKFEKVISDGTPRRLFLYIDGLPEKQDDREEIVIGPPAKIAMDKDGKFTKAALSFAESKGIDKGDLSIVTTEKGEYLQGIRKIKGIPTKDFIQKNITDVILKIPFKKTMRWGDKNIRFARPIHWFLSIFDGEILPFEIDGISASNITTGHRFMRGLTPGLKFPVKDFDEYKKLLKEAHVILSFEDRKAEIVYQIREIEDEFLFTIPIEEDLLNTVANLVECPFAILGVFPKEFLKLPDEVLITSMKVHQKYFYIKDDNGKLLNYFIGISNNLPINMNIQNGYERVLRARLTDAMFFFENDKKVPLDKRIKELKKVVYQEKLGTSWEKVERFTEIAKKLAEDLDESKLLSVNRAALLSKADLMTEMVYEFPELQGYMGMVYAKAQGETEDVATAIYEHYFPRFAGDKLPATFEGAVISIADKLDTICGCFAIGLIPTGNNDPYGLRRNAIGIINIIREKRFRIDLKNLISFSLTLLEKKVNFDKQEILNKVYEFIMQRFKQILINEDVDPEIFDALIDNYSDILTIEKAAKEITPKRGSEDFITVTTSYKRVANILKKSGELNLKLQPSKFDTKYENNLYLYVESLDYELNKLIKDEKFKEAIELLLSMRKPVDDFFDNVLVMDEDEEIRNNRLALLTNLKRTFDKLLRFDKIN